MKYVLLPLCLIAIMPACSLRKDKKKPSIHQKRKTSQRAAYAAKARLEEKSP